MGRNKIQIKWSKVESMAMAGANGKQIAAALGIHYDTLVTACKRDNNSDFSDYLYTKREKGNNLLLAKQYDVAMNGDRGMLIWLGKQRLDQSDKQQVKQETKQENTYNFDNLTTEQLEQLAKILTASHTEADTSGTGKA